MAKEYSGQEIPSGVSGPTTKSLKFYDIYFMDLKGDLPKNKLLQGLYKRTEILYDLTEQARNRVKRGYYASLMEKIEPCYSEP